MGNTLKSSSSSDSPFFHPHTFIQVAQKHEPLYGEVRIMYSSIVPDYYIVWQTISFTNKELFFKKLKTLEFHKKNPHSNILPLLDYRPLDYEEDFFGCSCGGALRIELAFEYFSRTLAEELLYKKDKGVSFEEEEIWNILKGVLVGLEGVYGEENEIQREKFVDIELILVEGEGFVKNVRLLNPNINRQGGFFDEMRGFNKEIGLDNEVRSLSIVCIRLMSSEMRVYKDEKYVELLENSFYSKELKAFIKKLLKDDTERSSLKCLLEEINGKKIEKESFVWNGIDLLESNGSFWTKEGLDIGKIEYGGMDNIRKEFFEDGEEVLQPIINLNYNSPVRQKEKNSNKTDWFKENWGFDAFKEKQVENLLD